MDTNNSVEFPRNSLTCLTCQIEFTQIKVRNEHYKSEWHRFNLHRKVAKLPSFTFDQYEKINEAKVKINVKQDSSCNICRKKFNTEKQYENHMKSNKHKQKMNKKSTDISNMENGINTSMHNETKMDVLEMDMSKMDVSEMDMSKMDVSENDEKYALKPSGTLCSWDSSNSLDTWDMYINFENFIESNTCLFCDHTSRTLTYLLKHMMVKHSFFVPDVEHCINIRDLLTYIGYKIYKFKCIWCEDSGKQFQSIEAAQAHMIDKGHCKIPFEGEALLEYSQFYDYPSSDLDAEQLALAEPSKDFSECEGFEMVLPSGKVIGHRALMCYYKQNLSSSEANMTNGRKLYKLMNHSATLKPEQVEEANKRRMQDIRYVQRTQSKYLTQLQFKKNKLQTYFKNQTN